MFNYVVVFAEDGDVDIHKFHDSDEVVSCITEYLKEYHSSEVVEYYCDYISGQVDGDWSYVPDTVEDYVRDMILEDKRALEDWHIYWE